MHPLECKRHPNLFSPGLIRLFRIAVFGCLTTSPCWAHLPSVMSQIPPLAAFAEAFGAGMDVARRSSSAKILALTILVLGVAEAGDRIAIGDCALQKILPKCFLRTVPVMCCGGGAQFLLLRLLVSRRGRDPGAARAPLRWEPLQLLALPPAFHFWRSWGCGDGQHVSLDLEREASVGCAVSLRMRNHR